MSSNTAIREVGSTFVLCTIDDLIENAGVCALYPCTQKGKQDEQIALYYLPSQSPAIYALNNWDPFGNANVLSRGILGDIDNTLVVASPLYKQHFSLLTGECLEDSEIRVKTYNVTLVDEKVMLLESVLDGVSASHNTSQLSA